MYAKKNSGIKVVATLLAIVLLIGIGIGGTVAWLIDLTQEVENTFTVGNIDIDLKETVGDDILSTDVNGVVKNNKFKIIPGKTEKKDPTVIVKKDSEDCFVFVKVVEKNTTYNDTEYVKWAIDPSWTLLIDAEDGKVYYREYSANAVDQEYPVLAGDEVSYSEDLTKEQIDALQKFINETYTDDPTDGLPTLTFKAYAVQKEGSSDAADAWAKID